MKSRAHACKCNLSNKSNEHERAAAKARPWRGERRRYTSSQQVLVQQPHTQAPRSAASISCLFPASPMLMQTLSYSPYHHQTLRPQDSPWSGPHEGHCRAAAMRPPSARSSSFTLGQARSFSYTPQYGDNLQALSGFDAHSAGIVTPTRGTKRHADGREVQVSPSSPPPCQALTSQADAALSRTRKRQIDRDPRVSDAQRAKSTFAMMMGASRALTRSGDGWNRAEAQVAAMHDAAAAEGGVPSSPIDDQWMGTGGSQRHGDDSDMMITASQGSNRQHDQRVFVAPPSQEDWRLSTAAPRASQDVTMS